MTMTLFLTWFLLLGGAFTVWCAIKNYDWYFSIMGLSGLLILATGRKIARVLFIIVGLAMLGWGVQRIVKPPPEIPPSAVLALARPLDISLVPPQEAKVALGEADSESIKDLKVDSEGWTSFWISITPDNPLYIHAANSAVAGPDFREGFALPKRTIGTTHLEGSIVYFNEAYEPCNNMLLSKRPLSSAVFVMVICSEKVSHPQTKDNSLMVYFLRAGTDEYQSVTRF